MKYACNPFNIRFTGQSWKGLTRSRNGFCEFVSLDAGIRAVLILMRTYRRKGFDTPRKIINRFAPPSENDTKVYLSFVCSHADLHPDEVLSFDRMYFELLHYMSIFESQTDISVSYIAQVARSCFIDIVPNKI